MRWRGLHDIDHGGISYGQKDKEFPQFLNLPQRTPQRFRLALMGAAPEKLVKAGWDVVLVMLQRQHPDLTVPSSSAPAREFSVAKQGYLVTKGGWFRDRSVCYLASGPSNTCARYMPCRLASHRCRRSGGSVTFPTPVEVCKRSTPTTNATV